MPYIGRNHIAGDHTSNFKVLDDISSYTATFNGSSATIVSTADETIRIPEHRFLQGQRVTYSNGGVGSGGNLNFRGGGGVSGNIDGQSNEESGGTGGSSYWGGGPYGGSVWGNRGTDGAPGAGGAGTHASTNNQGSSGKNGIVVVEEYA